jgi:hypothetical protein
MIERRDLRDRAMAAAYRRAGRGATCYESCSAKGYEICSETSYELRSATSR